MKNAETVTFGGSGLDRAGHLRGNIAPLANDSAARAVVVWRGKVLMDSAGDALLRVPLDHPVMADAAPERIFLGLDTDGPVFAVILSAWNPALPDEAQMGGFSDPTLQCHPATPQASFTELRSVMTALTPRDAELAATAKAVLSWHDSHRFCSACGVKSDLADGGWRRICPACKTQHFPRTDPVVIMLIVHNDSVLVGRSPGWPEGMFSLLAGFIEPGETIEAAVRREVFEESGVRVGAVTYLASQPWAFPSSLMIGCLGHATSTDITLDPAELEDALWLTRAQMQQVADGDHPAIKPARHGAIAHFLLENWLANRLE